MSVAGFFRRQLSSLVRVRVGSMSGQGSQHKKGELNTGDDQEQEQTQDIGARLTMKENRDRVHELE
jgi:hypothetical protein